MKILSAILATLLVSQVAPPDSGRQATVAWLRDHAIDVTVDDAPSGRDVAAIAEMIGSAHIIAFGESTHGTHEWLAIRNRVFEYLVEHGGVTALAVETGFREALTVDRFVTSGASDAPPDALVRAMISFADDGRGPGRTENRALIQWIEAYNRSHADRRIRVYGFDLSGRVAEGGFPNGPATINAALAFVATVDPQLGRTLDDRLRPLLPSFRTTSYRDKPYDGLTSAQRDALTSAIADLNTAFQSHAVQWRRETSAAEYAVAAQSAVAARQLDALLRINVGRGGLSPDALMLRDSVMAENVRWIAAQQPPQGRLFVFAHDVHVQKGSGTSMGSFLAESLGADVFTIGSTDAQRRTAGTYAPVPPQGLDGIGTICAETGRTAFVADLRGVPRIGPIHDWLSEPRRVNPISLGQTELLSIRLLDWYDALVFVQAVSFPP